MKKILVGLDGSKNSFDALKQAIELSMMNHAQIHTISVEELPHFPETISEVEEEKKAEDTKFHAIARKAQRLAEIREVAIETHILTGSDVKKEIIKYIEKNHFDLLVIGATGTSVIHERILGSTCQGLVRMAPCSVLVVK